jgi:hypothetical protein
LRFFAATPVGDQRFDGGSTEILSARSAGVPCRKYLWVSLEQAQQARQPAQLAGQFHGLAAVHLACQVKQALHTLRGC